MKTDLCSRHSGPLSEFVCKQKLLCVGLRSQVDVRRIFLKLISLPCRRPIKILNSRGYDLNIMKSRGSAKKFAEAWLQYSEHTLIVIKNENSQAPLNLPITIIPVKGRKCTK